MCEALRFVLVVEWPLTVEYAELAGTGVERPALPGVECPEVVECPDCVDCTE